MINSNIFVLNYEEVVKKIFLNLLLGYMNQRGNI